jgi:hypothetical protein
MPKVLHKYDTFLGGIQQIATRQAKPTEKKMEVIKPLLEYCATQEEAIIS